MHLASAAAMSFTGGMLIGLGASIVYLVLKKVTRR